MMKETKSKPTDRKERFNQNQSGHEHKQKSSEAKRPPSPREPRPSALLHANPQPSIHFEQTHSGDGKQSCSGGLLKSLTPVQRVGNDQSP